MSVFTCARCVFAHVQAEEGARAVLEVLAAQVRAYT